MITAKEAQEITEKSVIDEENRQLIDIPNEINLAAKSRLKFVEIEYSIMPKVQTQLEKNGFKVIVLGSPRKYKISW